MTAAGGAPLRLVLASNNAKKLAELQSLFRGLAVEVVAQGALGIDEADEPHATFLENALAKARHASAASGLAAIADDSGLCVDALGGAPGVISAHYAGNAGVMTLEPAGNAGPMTREPVNAAGVMPHDRAGTSGVTPRERTDAAAAVPLGRAGAAGAASALPPDDDAAPGGPRAGAAGAASDREARRRAQDAANNALLLDRLRGAADRRAAFACTLVALRSADDPQPLVAVGRWPGVLLETPRGANGFGYDPLLYLPDLGMTAAELDAETKNLHSHRARAMADLRAQMRLAWRV